jgi:hypothetical protein
MGMSSLDYWEKFFTDDVVIVWDFYVNPFHFSFSRIIPY